MMKKFKVIFVCAENITRSMSAEYCFKKYLTDNGIENIEVSSAGTDGTQSDTSNHCFAHFEELEEMGIDISGHKRTPLTQEIIDGADLIIAMSTGPHKWILENFHIDVPLYSEITERVKRSILVPRKDDPACDAYLRKMVKDFYSHGPKLLEYISKCKQK